MCYNCGCGLPDDDMGQGHAGETEDKGGNRDQAKDRTQREPPGDGRYG